MLVRNLKDRFLAVPWVYDRLRPAAAGGIDFRSIADFCECDGQDRIFDFGCGTGQLLPFLRFSEYVGVDLDSAALRRAARLSAANVRFLEGDEWDDVYRGLNPTVVLLIGVAHHLSDDDFRSALDRFLLPGVLPRFVTVDVSYFPGRPLNNLLSRMDRGRHVRTRQEYERLFRESGLRVTRSEIIATRLHYVQYAGYHLQAHSDPAERPAF
jgi:SAM-dependent methyltransferase